LSRQPPHPVQQDIPWMIAFAALMVSLFFALIGVPNTSVTNAVGKPP
jgi:hypothetical protein